MYPQTVTVELGTQSYDVVVGLGALGHLRDMAARLTPTSLLLISDSNVAPLHASAVRAVLHGLATMHEFAVPAGENSKSLSQLGALYDSALALRVVDRHTVVLALGGGVVGDLAGFFASTLLRGLACIQLPTSLLAMVDSGLGGKTAINHATGKNLIGAFHQPGGVICELEFLRTLPQREYVSALAEAVKTAAIGDIELFNWLEGNVDSILARDNAALVRLVHACVRFKATVVSQDERETSGRRATLNFGHTVAHAIESALPGAMNHGEAVAIGLAAAARLSVALVGLDGKFAARITALLGKFGLEVELPRKLDTPKLLAAMAGDKKRAGAIVNFVVLPRPGHAELLPCALDESLASTLAGRDG